jgi:hypothetical protein
VTHGGKGNHVLVEIYKTEAARDQMYAAYNKYFGFTPQELETGPVEGIGGSGGFGIFMTLTGINHYLTSFNAVVFAGECDSANIAETSWAGAQLFFGYNDTTSCANMNKDFTTILQRMDGKNYSPQAQGQDRTGEGAYFAGGGLSSILQCYQHGKRCQANMSTYTTVLSPGPTQCYFTSNPPQCGDPFPVTIFLRPKQPGSGQCPCTTTRTEASIIFDTLMLTDFQPAYLLGPPGGCAAITGQHWEPLAGTTAGSSTLNVDLESNAQGNASDTLIIDPEKALAGAPSGSGLGSGPHFKNLLDGNAVGPVIDKKAGSYNYFKMPIKCVVKG